jgi:hypothetical protein
MMFRFLLLLPALSAAAGTKENVLVVIGCEDGAKERHWKLDTCVEVEIMGRLKGMKFECYGEEEGYKYSDYSDLGCTEQMSDPNIVDYNESYLSVESCAYHDVKPVKCGVEMCACLSLRSTKVGSFQTVTDFELEGCRECTDEDVEESSAMASGTLLVLFGTAALL